MLAHGLAALLIAAMLPPASDTCPTGTARITATLTYEGVDGSAFVRIRDPEVPLWNEDITSYRGETFRSSCLPVQPHTLTVEATQRWGRFDGVMPGAHAVLHLQPLGSLEGSVAGARSEGAEIRIWMTPQDVAPRRDCENQPTTDSTGVFKFKCLHAGTIEVHIDLIRKMIGTETVVRSVTIEPGKTTRLAVNTEEGDVGLSGLLLDALGRPLAGEGIWAEAPAALREPLDEEGPYRVDGCDTFLGHYMQSVTTSADGSFVMHGLTRERWRLRTRTRDSEGELVVVPPARDVVLKTRPFPRVFGRVVDVTGKPINAFVLGGRTFTDEAGAFDWTGEPRSLLRVDADGYAGRVLPLQKDVTEPVDIGAITLRPVTSTVRLRVIDAEGKPVSFARTSWFGATTDVDGRLTMDEPWMGVEIEHEGFESLRVAAEDLHAETVVTMKPRGSIRGRFVSRAKPSPLMYVSLSNGFFAGFADGWSGTEVAFDDLRPGRYFLQWNLRDGAQSVREVRVAGGRQSVVSCPSHPPLASTEPLSLATFAVTSVRRRVITVIRVADGERVPPRTPLEIAEFGEPKWSQAFLSTPRVWTVPLPAGRYTALFLATAEFNSTRRWAPVRVHTVVFDVAGDVTVPVRFPADGLLVAPNP